MHDQGKNKVKFAEAIGISPRLISHIFTGRIKLRMDMLFKMAQYIGASHITTDKNNRKSVNQEG